MPNRYTSIFDAGGKYPAKQHLCPFQQLPIKSAAFAVPLMTSMQRSVRLPVVHPIWWMLARPNIAKELWGVLKTYWREGWHWPPAGKLWISGIQKVKTLNFAIWDPNLVILNKCCRNSSFTKSLGLIIASSRSGTCFSSCLASSIYFYITNNMFFV